MSRYCQSFIKHFFTSCFDPSYRIFVSASPALSFCVFPFQKSCHNIVVLISNQKRFVLILVPHLVYFTLSIDKILCLWYVNIKSL